MKHREDILIWWPLILDNTRHNTLRTNQVHGRTLIIDLVLACTAVSADLCVSLARRRYASDDTSLCTPIYVDILSSKSSRWFGSRSQVCRLFFIFHLKKYPCQQIFLKEPTQITTSIVTALHKARCPRSNFLRMRIWHT